MGVKFCEKLMKKRLRQVEALECFCLCEKVFKLRKGQLNFSVAGRVETCFKRFELLAEHQANLLHGRELPVKSACGGQAATQ